MVVPPLTALLPSPPWNKRYAQWLALPVVKDLSLHGVIVVVLTLTRDDMLSDHGPAPCAILRHKLADGIIFLPSPHAPVVTVMDRVRVLAL